MLKYHITRNQSYFSSMMIFSSCSLGGVCGATSLDLDLEDPPERTKLDDPHVLSGTYNLSIFYFTLNTSSLIHSVL